jgi:hypothetical protein
LTAGFVLCVFAAAAAKVLLKAGAAAPNGGLVSSTRDCCGFHDEELFQKKQSNPGVKIWP